MSGRNLKEEPGEILAPLWIQVLFVLTNLSDGSDVVMQLGAKGREEFLAVVPRTETLHSLSDASRT